MEMKGKLYRHFKGVSAYVKHLILAEVEQATPQTTALRANGVEPNNQTPASTWEPSKPFVLPWA